MIGAAAWPPHPVSLANAVTSSNKRGYRGQSQDEFHLPAVWCIEPCLPRSLPRLWRLEFDDRDDRGTTPTCSRRGASPSGASATTDRAWRYRDRAHSCPNL